MTRDPARPAGTHPGLSVHAAAREAGDRPGLVAEGRTWTWAALAREARAERRRLEDAGLLGDSAVPVAFDARAEPASVIRLLALLEAGVPAVPLHPGLSAGDRASRLRWLKCVDADFGSHGVGAAADDTVDRSDMPPGDSAGLRWESRPAIGAGSAATSRGPERTASVLFTSGSTGAPRLVELSVSVFLASAAASAAHLGWREDDRWLCCLPLAHVGGLSVLTRCLAARRTIVLAPGFEADAFAETVEREGISLASVVPTMLHRLFEASDRWRAPSRLRVVLMGGAAAGAGLWDEIERRGLPVLETYGMTETCSQVATGRPGSPRRLEPLRNVRLRIRDDRVEVAGPMVCSRVGRVESDDARRAFTADGYLRTADVGSLEDGSLVVRGRADETIVTGGENVSPLEVEGVLEQHPAVRRAVVFGVPHDEWGEIVAAALERRGGVPVPASEALRDWVSERLASFQRPRRVAWFVTLPETLTGKPDRAATRMAALSVARDL